MPTPPSPDSEPSPESLLADYLARRADGSPADLEALCGAHPQHAKALRELLGQYDRLQAALRAAGASGDRPGPGRARSAANDARSGPADARDVPSFAARLKQKYGAGVDPEISLDAAPEAGARAARGQDAGENAARADQGQDPNASAPTDALVRRLKEHSLVQSRYQLEGELARGGMGAILRVWDEDLRRHLAMKVILGRGEAPSEGGTPAVEPHQLARFLEEAQVTGQLDHPGIVPVHELGLDSDGRVYFTMKLVKGRDLKAIFDLVFANQENWNETRALSVILKACEAMAYAHTKGVIHRDLKPANVMVGNFGEVYVMDWGLARVVGRKDTHDIRLAPEFETGLGSVKTERRDEREDVSDSPIVTMDGDVMGTPAYMAPEQARGEIEKLGPRSDVYSMGCLLYHLLARRAPYVSPGMRVSNRTVLALVLNGPPPALSTLRKDVPAELVAISEKAMSREASQRYADTLALAEDLRAFLEHRVVGAYESGAWAEARKWVQRNKPLAASLAGAVVLLVAGLTASLVFKARADTESTNAKANETRALAGEADAKRQERLAKEQEMRAREQEQLATRKANDVLSLSAIQELKELEDEADRLWPADPELVPLYEPWLEKARVLVEGRAQDEGPGKPVRPSLADHERKLAEIRLRARERTAEEVERDRRASASFAEWEKARGELVWLRRMLGEEPWPAEAEVEAELARGIPPIGSESAPLASAGAAPAPNAGAAPALASGTESAARRPLPTDATALNELAWPLVDPDPAKIVYGGEVRGLLLARRAVAAAKPEERAMLRDTLAWALFRTGRFDEALAEERRAVDEIESAKHEEYLGYLASLERAVGEWRGVEARAQRAQRAGQLAEHVTALEHAVSERRTFEFDDSQDRWWHTQLGGLVANLRVFTDAKAGGLYSSGTSPAHGWGIVKRAEFARTILERSVAGPEAKRRWAEALEAISRSAKYADARWAGGKLLTPQVGLLPIGADPASGLWEFAHLQSGDEPDRGPDGRALRDAAGHLLLKETMGLVFVLLPGGTFWMGAQKDDPNGQNYDPQAADDESPVHEVTLTAYFLSKYEMTQGQWERLTGKNPSQYGPRRYSKTWNRSGKGWTGLHPVEQVTWTGCQETLGRLGLELPSEAQWECGCRAGTESVYWTGPDVASLTDAANLSDAYGKSHGGSSRQLWERDFDDGNTGHAEIGSYRANAYGLHDVHGNVWEWCHDSYADYSGKKQIEPVTPVTGALNRVSRGGGFIEAASIARSAIRRSSQPENRNYTLGLRPARASQLPTSQLHLPVK